MAHGYQFGGPRFQSTQRSWDNYVPEARSGRGGRVDYGTRGGGANGGLVSGGLVSGAAPLPTGQWDAQFKPRLGGSYATNAATAAGVSPNAAHNEIFGNLPGDSAPQSMFSGVSDAWMDLSGGGTGDNVFQPQADRSLPPPPDPTQRNFKSRYGTASVRFASRQPMTASAGLPY